LRAALGSCQEFGLYSTDSYMANGVWSIQHRQVYGNCCLVYTAQTAVWQLLFSHTVQTVVWQLLFGL